ncbi:hypothetical protein [Halobacterium litoreum]|uniref:DUF8055 domain-containing protein n=1 Tax=Halobacterium litoreum TaxID=2039234 RepID=A0ABD5NG27_9EURY|nr:hypothetical protein [Halobacterium litoreum]UHH12854.1 hypothetical protein LT972_11885 [Halobacterium litoreum]
MTGRSRYWDRVREIADRAQRHRERFDPPSAPPDEERAMTFLREGVGPAVSVYVEGRTGGERVPFTDVEVSLLERSLNSWLSLYAACYGVELETDYSIREAATVLVDTRNVADTAQLLTRVPER